MKLNDITGKRFGRLVVKSYVGKKKWLCICDCGRETIALASNLKRGHTTSCGCARANASLHGKVFGNLCVIERAKGDDPRRVYYKCKCDCGNECIVRSDALQSGDVKSRGKWQASIRFRGHKYNLGRFDSEFEAAEIRAAAEKELFGNFLEWYERYKSENE